MAIIFDDKESFATMCRRQAEGLKLISNEMEQEKKEQQELRELQKKRAERKGKLLFDNLDLIMRHREEILATPRYANIDAHYAIKGGGLYIGQVTTLRRPSFAGTTLNIGLKLGTLLRIWDTDQFKVECRCGGTAVIRSFSGSPLSGGSHATAYCPKCKKEPHIGNRSFGAYYGIVKSAYAEDIENFAKEVIAKWNLAEVEYEKKLAQGCSARWSRVGECLRGDDKFCDLETMINELKMKEFSKR